MRGVAQQGAPRSTRVREDEADGERAVRRERSPVTTGSSPSSTRLITGHRDQGWGVRELAEAVGLSRSTVNRILQGLTARGLARVDANSTYFVGPRLRVLAKVLHDRHPLLRGAPQVMDELSRAADATVMLAVHGPRPDTAFIALLRRQAGPIRYHLEPGMELPLHAGAAGRAILSAVGVDVLRPLISPATATDTVVDPTPARRGTADRPEGRLRDQRRPAHPARRRRRRPLCRSRPVSSASVSATRLRHDTTDTDLDRLGPIVRKTADAIEDAARGRPPPSAPPPRRVPTPPRSGASSAFWRSSSPSPPAPRPAPNSPAS